MELPTVFATSNAELFAKGAVHILSEIPCITHLSFGAESPDVNTFLIAAKLLNDEPSDVSAKIKTLMQEGVGHAKAFATAWEDKIPADLLSSPNNILGVEYTKALLLKNTDIQILPIQRIGSDYNDTVLQEEFSSATAIRHAIQKGEKTNNCLPDFVLNDLQPQSQKLLDVLEKHAILSTPLEEIKGVCDCTEGLEFAFKKAAELGELLENTLTSARYTSARIRRIALQNLLKIKENSIRESLCSPLYLHVLAAKKCRNDVLSALSESNAPLIIRAHDEEKLSATAKACFNLDIYAEKIYTLLNNGQPKEKRLFI